MTNPTTPPGASLLDSLYACLMWAGWKPRIWRKHGKVRVYVDPRRGKKLARRAKVCFDFAEAWEADSLAGNCPPGTGATLRVWHPYPPARQWLEAQMLEALAFAIPDHTARRDQIQGPPRPTPPETPDFEGH